MFERFTERARQVVVLAQDESRRLGHDSIGTEHILLGLLREEEGIAARVLETLDVTLEEVQADVIRVVGRGETPETGQIPFTPGGKKTLELALREAVALGHDYIGTEHVLLGLVRADEGVGAEILREHDADPERIRQAIIRMLSGVGAARRAEARTRRGRADVPTPRARGARRARAAHPGEGGRRRATSVRRGGFPPRRGALPAVGRRAARLGVAASNG